MCKRDRMPFRLPPDPIIDLVVNLSIWGAHIGRQGGQEVNHYPWNCRLE